MAWKDQTIVNGKIEVTTRVQHQEVYVGGKWGVVKFKFELDREGSPLYIEVHPLTFATPGKNDKGRRNTLLNYAKEAVNALLEEEIVEVCNVNG